MKFTTMRLCVATLLLSAAFATSLEAQRRADVRGFHLGAAVNASSIKLDETAFSDDERENGYGAEGYLGYNFTRNLGVTFSITAANINDSGTEDFSLTHLDLGGRASFPGTSMFVPYLEVSLARVGAEYDAEGQEVELEGLGMGLGAGFNYFFGRQTAIDASFRYTFGELDAQIADRDVDTGDGLGFNTTRLKIGIAFYP